MRSKQEIFKVYKTRGMSMGRVVNRFKEENLEYRNSPITFAGRLDPLAEGLVLLLIGYSEEQKKEILKMPKEYEFDFVLGFETDTYDILGIVNKANFSNLNFSEREIVSSLNKVRKNKTQEYPPFSSKTVKGKPLYKWAREEALDDIEIPKRDIEIFNINILEIKKINSKDFLKNIENSVSLVEGDFRQHQIIDCWQSTLAKVDEELIFIKMKALVSSGTYIRGIVKDIGKDIGCGAVVYSIKRTKIGDMEIG